MSQVTAQAFQSFVCAAATDDGAHLVLQAHVCGQPVTLAIPENEVPRLLMLLSLAANDTAARRGICLDPKALAIHDASCVPSQRGDGLVLRLHLFGGIHVAAVGSAQRMVELAADMQELAFLINAVEPRGAKHARH